MTTQTLSASPAEKFASQFGGLMPGSASPDKLYPEGKDCYEDPARAEEVEASYASVNEQLMDCRPDEPILLIGRRIETSWPNGGRSKPVPSIKRVLALGRLAGGFGLFYDFRGGQVVFPTKEFAIMKRDSLTAITKRRPAKLYGGSLASGKVIDFQGFLPPKEDLVDTPMHAKMNGHYSRINSAEKFEAWDPACTLAIGTESVSRTISRLIETGSKRDQKIFTHDFAELFGKLAVGNSASLLQYAYASR